MCLRSKNPVICGEVKMSVGRLIPICYWSLKCWNSIMELDGLSSAWLPWCQSVGAVSFSQAGLRWCARLPNMPGPSVLIRWSDSLPHPQGPLSIRCSAGQGPPHVYSIKHRYADAEPGDEKLWSHVWGKTGQHALRGRKDSTFFSHHLFPFTFIK